MILDLARVLQPLLGLRRRVAGVGVHLYMYIYIYIYIYTYDNHDTIKQS